MAPRETRTGGVADTAAAGGIAASAATPGTAQDNHPPDAAELIAAHLARVGYDDLPSEVIDASKAAILDTLGCLLAGTATAEMDAVVSLVAERGGRPVSTVIGRGFKVPAEAAVLANAAAIHQYDYDDTHDIAVCHPTSASLIPALALAEQAGNVPGKALIAAVALSNDITSRVALAIEGRLTDYHWFRAPVVGLFGATAAACKILGASERQHLEALGLTLPMVGGTLSSLQHGGSNVRAIRDGMAYRNGVLAAELAMRGVRGDRRVFEGPHGYYHAFFRGEYRRERLVGGLGEVYETSRVSLKPWPAIRHLHRALSCVTDLLTDHALAFDDIDEVIVHVGKINLDRCRPVALGAIPQQRMDLLSNLPFAVGAVIRHGRIPLAVYRDSALADDVVRVAMPKVSWTYDERLDGAWTFEPGIVRIRTRDGRELAKERRVSTGHPDDPMSRQARVAKFRDCALAAARPLVASRMAEVIAMVDRLEQLDDVSALARLLA